MRSRLFFAAALGALGELASGQGAAGDYLVLDDTPRDFTNLNAEAVRPLNRGRVQVLLPGSSTGEVAVHPSLRGDK